MKKAEYLLTMADKCTTKAINSTDPHIKTFYAKAAQGFKIKLEKLTLEECQEDVLCK